jgi:hypothetical protein
MLVPGERIELPTRGLQNRCSTTELTRLYWGFSLSLPELASALLAKSPPLVQFPRVGLAQCLMQKGDERG